MLLARLPVFYKAAMFAVPILLFPFRVSAQDPCPTSSFPGCSGFIENKGQVNDPHVFFKARVSGIGIFVTDSGLTYVFIKARDTGKGRYDLSSASWSKVQVKLEGASIRKENIVTADEEPGYCNFFYEHCPDGIFNVHTYHTVTVKNIYPGIDWVLSGRSASRLEYDFIIHPGADPSRISLCYRGATSIKLISGRLEVESPCGKVSEGRLVCKEKNSGKTVRSSFLVSGNRVAIGLGAYDRSSDLVIDPPLLWSATQTGSVDDFGYAVAAMKDGSGNVYIAGESNSTNYPLASAFQGTNAGSIDVVFAKLASATGARLWSTYYGSTGDEGARGVATDNSGNCYVTGYTSSAGFPKTTGAAGGGVYDGFLLGFTTAGARTYGKLFGGSATDYGTSVVSDGTGVTYCAGFTSSTNFPTAGPALQSAKSTGYDAYVMKSTAAGATTWATYYGGNDDDKAYGIALNSAATIVYFTGFTLSTNFPGTAGSFQAASASFSVEDAFIVALNTTTQVKQYAAYCGGSDVDIGQGIAVNSAGNAFITGYTLSSNFPCTNPGGVAYFDNSYNSPGSYDAFIFECNSTGTTKVWGTYFGGSAGVGTDMGLAIAIDASDGIYVTGSTSCTDFPVQAPADVNYYDNSQNDGGGFNDAFILWFTSNFRLQWSTFYGTANNDEGHGISLDPNKNIFVAGITGSDLMSVKFTKGSGLPIELSVFTGQCSANGTLLNWTTATETNNDFFTIERSSDGEHFLTVKFVDGAGNSSSPLYYSALDEEPPYGLNYYRLKQTDFDGHFTYSPIIAVEEECAMRGIKLYPNPATDQLTVSLHDSDKTLQCEILDAFGRPVALPLPRISPENTIVILDIRNLAPGLYFVCITSGSNRFRQKFIKH
jgi:hypothetical protein